MVCECSFDDVNGEYATYALAWGEACVHDVSVDAAFVQRVADALNGQDVSPEHVYNVQKRRAKKQNFRNILRKFDSGIPFVRPFVVTPPTLCYNK